MKKNMTEFCNQALAVFKCLDKPSYNDSGAMVYIVVVVCIFAMGIALLIAAQMSYNPEGEGQVRHYLKQRSILKDRILLAHNISKQREKKDKSCSVEYGNQVYLDNLSDTIYDDEDEDEEIPAARPHPILRQSSLPAKLFDSEKQELSPIFNRAYQDGVESSDRLFIHKELLNAE